MSREEKIGGAVFIKTEAPNKMPLKFPISKAGVTRLKAMGLTKD